MRDRLARWLDVRPREVGMVALSCAGAFLALAYLVLARALREAIYLTRFPVETLPYITAAVAISSVPVVALFARRLGRHAPQRVLLVLVLVMAAGIAGLWPLLRDFEAAVVAFYLWTALGALLLTSGFWLVTAELFPLRGAKRLFGLVGAGGTIGAMATGNALAFASGAVGVESLVPGLLGVLALFAVVQLALPAPVAASSATTEPRGPSLREGLRLVGHDPHLRVIAGIVAVSTVASTLVDYQFKELARAAIDTGEGLAGFFGAFYGWTGGVALAIQVLLTGRFLGRAGVAITLAVLPAALVLGAAGLFVLPTLVLATLVRGTDSSLRKSLHRSALEVVFVPVPTGLRRRTKTFIDSVADSAAEGVGAGIVFLVVTWGGLPSRWLSLGVAAFAFVFLWLARRAGRSYLATVAAQLREGARTALADERDLMSGTFTRIDVRALLESDEADGVERVSRPRPSARRGAVPVELPAAGVTLPPDALRREDLAAPESRDEAVGTSRGTGEESRDEDGVAGLVRLLARDDRYRAVTNMLARREQEALPRLSAMIRDPEAPFAVRRRIPAVLARYESVDADEALLAGIEAPRFEVRYRSAVALVHRRRSGRASAAGAADRIWRAIEAEVSRERPVWELQRLLDPDEPRDAFVRGRVVERGQLSLEHTFRLLSLVRDSEAVSSAYHGLASPDDRLRSLALEYLDHTLPEGVRRRLWPFIGDLSEHQRTRRERPLEDVVSDLVTSSHTVFLTAEERGALRDLLDDEEEDEEA